MQHFGQLRLFKRAVLINIDLTWLELTQRWRKTERASRRDKAISESVVWLVSCVAESWLESCLLLCVFSELDYSWLLDKFWTHPSALSLAWLPLTSLNRVFRVRARVRVFLPSTCLCCFSHMHTSVLHSAANFSILLQHRESPCFTKKHSVLTSIKIHNQQNDLVLPFTWLCYFWFQAAQQNRHIYEFRLRWGPLSLRFSLSGGCKIKAVSSFWCLAHKP